MKKKLIKTLTPILILSIIFAVYLIKKNSEINKKENFNRFVEGINLSRSELFKNAPSIKDEYINWHLGDEYKFTPEETKEFVEYQKLFFDKNLILNPNIIYNEKKVITYDEAKEDVDSLFKFFRYGYGAYGYFGGDTVFNEAKENIMDVLNGQQSIKADDFSNLLLNNLNFIKDCHFALANKNPFFTRHQIYYIYNKDEFFKDANGYYKIVDKKHYYIKAINKDSNIDKYMKYTINNDGKLVYSIAILQEEVSSTINTDVVYSNDKEDFSESIVLNILPFDFQKENIPFEYSIEDNVPIAKLGAMYASSEEDDSQFDFPGTGFEMKKYPVSILDLRGNKGGFVTAGTSWIQSYSDGFVEIRGACTGVSNNMIKEFEKYNGNYISNAYSTTPTSLSRIPNDKLVFVLIDKAIASSGEYFIECLMNMDNVILVGTNTLGANITRNAYYYKLKNSSITVRLGSGLYLQPCSNDFEFNGFHPDILVDSNEALEKVQKLIKYYNLK
ncbi:S41 family peptidase [Clostridium sp. ATCC 25772]|uniref:S41 family peptidase n=1 Tax=Clostridium sp. ATCC 25772 TaxID=1676991 RepID=UPI0007842274|nr:S41 family peptidase [Clostridium sp. ATCC 25772]